MRPKLVLRFLGVGLACAAFSTVLAQSALAAGNAPDTDGSACDEALSQPFLSYGIPGWYWLAPGQSGNEFLGTGWTLAGGAAITTTTIANGETSQVLELPPGATAASPTMCIQQGDVLARMFTRMTGGRISASNSFQAFNAATQAPIGGAMPVVGMPSWNVSPPVIVAPGLFRGTSEVYFTFAANSRSGDFELYDFYVDPFMRD